MKRGTRSRSEITQPAEGEQIRLQNIYLKRIRREQAQDIWIVDGARVRSYIYDEFLEGGNDQRYRFVPPNEVWVDSATSSEEFEYAIMHELHERALMKRKGMTYDKAHESALMLELDARRQMRRLCRQHELEQPYMPASDMHGTQEIPDIGDKVQLRDIYHYRLGKHGGQMVWVVDGSHVRRDIFPDFGFSGNDRAYKFIPPNEIWIDNQVNCFELEYQIIHQVTMRAALVRGSEEGVAYGKGSQAQLRERRMDEQSSKRKEQRTLPVEGGARERGTKAASNLKRRRR